MMFQECPVCHDDQVHDEGPYSETCRCESCGAQFKIEPDADMDGEDSHNCSTVGERIDE